MALPPLTPEAVAPFINVLRAPSGKAGEIPDVLERGDVAGRHAYTILCPQPVDAGAIPIRFLERHPHSTQTFLPLSVSRWVVCLAPTAADGTPDLKGLRAYLAGPSDAICIGRNVWHAALTVLDRRAEVGMIMWKAEAGDDGIVFDLPEPVMLSA